MKKIIHMIFVCSVILATVSLTPKQMIKSIPVTKNEKEILVDTKALKQAETPAEKADAALKLSEAIKKDKYAQLILAREDIQKAIKYLENLIYEQGGYFFDSEEITEARAELADLKEELTKIQTELAIMEGERPQAVSRLKEWAVHSLIAAVGLALADQFITGGAGRAALMTGAGTAASKVGTALSTAWSYVPSFRSNTPESAPSVPSSGALSTTTKPTTGSIGSSIAAGAGTVGRKIGSGLETAWSYVPSGQTAFHYGSWTVSLGLLLFDAKRLKAKIISLITGEQEKLNPDQQKLAELYEQLQEQDKKIEQLETAIAKEKNN